jgi:hypothetical protein
MITLIYGCLLNGNTQQDVLPQRTEEDFLRKSVAVLVLKRNKVKSCSV